MKTIDRLLQIAENKKNREILLRMLEKSLAILSAVEISSPSYARDINKILDDFYQLLGYKK